MMTDEDDDDENEDKQRETRVENQIFTMWQFFLIDSLIIAEAREGEESLINNDERS